MKPLLRLFDRVGVPSMAYYVDRFTNKRQMAVSPTGQVLGMEAAFNTLMEGRESEFDAQTLAEADIKFDEFRNKPKKPGFAYYRARSTFKTVRNALVNGPKSLVESHRLYTEYEYDRICGRLVSPLSSVLHWPQKAIRMARLEFGNLLEKSPNLDCKFFFSAASLQSGSN